MPVINLDVIPMLLLLCLGAPFVQVGGALSAKLFKFNVGCADKGIFKTRKFEKNGTFYKKFFFVHIWKEWLPDGAAMFKNDFRKKRLASTETEYLEKFIAESCRAELAHILGMVPFLLFFLFVEWWIALIMVAYGIIVNFPCIIAQRYNRPRLKAALQMLKRKNTRSSDSI
ncbi:MAG: glycosyl-4,4'-diaponeurosporenoate acyltransferase [Clostridia bacterium]|jgi:glycosyl-4,4'-diaponeurosporenoate acyltransferase|nr:glycosyl-4,4'-diaponeurosporenoate acyltransferase [Clostridia bacterium]